MLAGLESLQDGYDNERGDQGDRAESDDELSDEEAVPFKCINAAHENHYQHHLKKAYLTLYEQDKAVNVRIRPEPLNPRVSSAIAIDPTMKLNGPMLVIYIASELCKYLHPLNAARVVVDVYV